VELPLARCKRAAIPRELAPDSSLPHWRDAEVVEMREAVRGDAPNQGTRVRMAWSADEWRILFECDDQLPWATLTERDAPLFSEETVEVFFDPIGDLESYYEVETNPLGAVLDIVFRRSRSGYKGDWAWNCDALRVAAAIIPGGWAAEIAIPFLSVATAPQQGTRWRANFCRIDRPARDGSLPREISAWSPPMRDSFHTQERFGIVEFAV
jgi:hypothetical protein